MTNEARLTGRAFRTGNWAGIFLPVTVLGLAGLLAGCQDTAGPHETEAAELGSTETPAAESWFPTASAPATAILPAGHAVTVRLNHGLSSAENRSGDSFTATLDQPLEIDGVMLAPQGTRVSGLLAEVKDSGRVKGTAAMTLVLKELMLGDGAHSIETRPIHLGAESTKKEDAAKIGAGSAIGAAIGAIAGGGDGAAKGAAIGAGAGTGVVLGTKGKPVELGAETRLSFTLEEAVELPVFEEADS
jgi:hypothetical protein